MISEKTVEELEAIYAELEAQTDRGAAIIAAAILDERLTEALKRRLILTSRLSENLFSFDKNGSLAHLAQKIDIAFAVGMIRPNIRDDLHNIRRIRNLFAHTVEPLKFDNPKIAGWCACLSTKSDLVLPRHRYLISTGRISLLLSILFERKMRLTPVEEHPDLEESIDRAFKRARHDA